MSSLTFPETLRHQRELEFRFICEVRKTYGQLADRSVWDISYPTATSLEYAHRCYDEGRRVLKIVSGTWDEFLGFLNRQYGFTVWTWRDGQSSYYKSYPRHQYSYLFTRNPGLHFREGLKYRRQPHHAKKPKNPKAEWLSWIKGKHENRPNYRRHEKAGRLNKQWNHRKNRRAARQAIHDGRWDEFTQAVQDIQRVWWD